MERRGSPPSDTEVKVTYDRESLDLTWRHSHHTAYVLWPPSEPAPVLPSRALY